MGGAGAGGTAADDDNELGERWIGDGRGLAGAEQAEPSTITKVRVPRDPTFKAHHLWVSGEQLCCGGRGDSPRIRKQ